MKLFINHIKQYTLIVMIFVIFAFFSIYFNEPDQNIALHLYTYSTTMIFIPVVTIFLIYKYYYTFYGKGSVITRTLVTDRWKPYVYHIILSSILLIIIVSINSLIILETFKNTPSYNFTIGYFDLFSASIKDIPAYDLYKHYWNLFFSYIIVLFEVSAFIFSGSCLLISLVYSNLHKLRSKLFIVLLIIIALYIISRMSLYATLIVLTETIIPILCQTIIHLIISFYLYIKHGIIQN